jgi:tetratricopeptide (TPR) repeat protein
VDEQDFFADVFRRFCDDAGLSVRKAADLLGHSRSVVGGWRTGRTIPPPDEAERIDKVLGAGGRLASAARMPGANGSGERLAYVEKKPRSVDAASVAAMHDVLAGMRRLEDSIGAERLLVVTAEPHRLAEELADEATGDIRHDVVDLAGQWAQFAGWLRAAQRRFEGASHWYATSLEHATEAGNEDLIATTLSMRGNLAWMAKRPGPLIGLSKAAAEKARAPGLRAMAAQQEARGYALLKDGDQVDELFDEAEAEMASAVEHPENEPAWTYFYTPGYLQMQRGLAYRLLGRTEDAIARLGDGLKAAGDDVGRSEFVAEYKIQLAEVHLGAGNRDVAESLMSEVREVARATGSARLAGEIARLEHDLGI